MRISGIVESVLINYWRQRVGNTILLDKYEDKGCYVYGNRVIMHFQYVAGADHDMILREIAAEVIFGTEAP